MIQMRTVILAIVNLEGGLLAVRKTEKENMKVLHLAIYLSH